MRSFVLLTLMAVAAAAVSPQVDFLQNAAIRSHAREAPAQHNQILINILVNQLINYVRRVINNGSVLFGVPPLDPLELDHFQLNVPAGLINLDIEITKGIATGFGGFVVNRSLFRAADLTFDIDLTFPIIHIEAEEYKLNGDLFTAVPLYGNGKAKFTVNDLRVTALLHLKQSENGESIIIDWIERPWFEMPSIKSELTGVIGGGDIDGIVNAIVEEVVVDYANRFHGVIAELGAIAVIRVLNPVLGKLDTWKYIERFV